MVRAKNKLRLNTRVMNDMKIYAFFAISSKKSRRFPTLKIRTLNIIKAASNSMFLP